MKIGIDRLCECIEDYYCNDFFVQIIKTDGDGHSSINVEKLLIMNNDKYITFEDETDMYDRIKKTNILSIELVRYEYEEIIITTKIKKYEFVFFPIIVKD